MTAQEQPTSRLWLLGIVAVVGVLSWLWFAGEPRDGSADDGQPAATEMPRRRMLTGNNGGDETITGLRQQLLHARKAAIHGTITSADGRPLGGANVCVHLKSPLLVQRPLKNLTCVTSRGDGGYRIEGLLPVDASVVASAPGHIPAAYRKPQRGPRENRVELTPGADIGNIDIVLKDGGVEVNGVVRDISGGEIEGAQVSVDNAFAESDSEGKFQLWVEPGETRIRAAAEGYASGAARGAAPGHFFEVLLTPESILVGKVVDAETGAGLADINVYTDSFVFYGVADGPQAITREDGSFRIDGLEPGGYQPIARSNTAFGKAAQTVHLGLGETSEPVTIKAHPATVVEGTIVVADSEKTCLDGRVSLRAPELSRNFAGQTQRGGEVRIEGVLPGTYQVDVTCENYVPEEHYPALEVGETVEPQTWEVAPGLAIRGIVVDAMGQAVEGQTVIASLVSSDADPRAKSPSFSFGMQTRDDGTFEVGGLSAGTYELRSFGVRPSPVDKPQVELVDSDVDDVRIELPGEGSVRGQVVDERGEPVANVNVELASREAKYVWGGGTSGMSADDGTFLLEHIPPGKYRITASRGWTSTLRKPGTTDDDVQGEPLDVEADEVTQVTLEVEARGASIRGRVVDGSGGPVADAFISATRTSDSAAATAASNRRQVRWGQWGQQPVLTDTDGTFELPDLTEGTYVVRANRKGGGEGLAEGCHTGAACEVVIRETGVLRGQVTLAGGPAPENFEVSLRDRKAGISRRESFFRTDGVFTFEQLPGGHYEVTASAGKGTATGQVELEDGEEYTGLNLDMQATVTVRGTVVDADSGEPVAGLWVRIVPKSGGRFGMSTSEERSEISDENGRFKVANAPSGTVQVSLMPKSFLGGSDYAWTTLRREIPADAAEHELAPIEVFKRRLDRDETPGDLGYQLRQLKEGEEWATRSLEVAVVTPGGPAAAAGLKVGDVIVSVDGQDVTGDNLYRYGALARVRAGTAITLGVSRGASLKLVARKRQ